MLMAYLSLGVLLCNSLGYALVLVALLLLQLLCQLVTHVLLPCLELPEQVSFFLFT